MQISYFSAFDDIKSSSSRNNQSVGCLSLAEDLYRQLRLLKKLFASQCKQIVLTLLLHFKGCSVVVQGLAPLKIVGYYDTRRKHDAPSVRHVCAVVP